MSSEPVRQSRFTFPFPAETHDSIRRRILRLMIDGKRRSAVEIQEALGTRCEVGARIRELRSGKYGPNKDSTKWPFNDSRAEGCDEDGIYRWELIRERKEPSNAE